MARLDVRENLRQGRPPIGRITEAVDQLAPDEKFTLVTPFEPIPLISMMRSRGYSHQARQKSPTHWETVFTPSSARHAETRGKSPACPGQNAATDIREVDARGLEPPEPMVRILSALDELPRGVVLRGLTDRRPIHLLDAIAERGFKAESFEQSPGGSWITDIRHPD